MHRGEVWTVSLDPSVGSEATKTWPAVIVSNDARNTVSARNGRGVITVVPLTTKVTRLLPFQVLIEADARNGLEEDSKAQAEQIRSLDASRLIRSIGRISPQHLAALEVAILLHLDID